MKTVRVDLEERSYSIQVGSGLLNRLGRWYSDLKLGRRCAVISDRRVAPHYAASVSQTLRKAGVEPVLITVPSGETAKRMATVESCYSQLARFRLERSSCIAALGGGVVGDLAGFVAATYLRGIPFIQIPTTLLAQVDSSVGGKTGVNLAAGKNLVGAFYQPRLVVCDLDTFQSLPQREFQAGLAEVIKYGVIYDPQLFRLLEREMPGILQRDSKLLARIVARSCEIKAEVVGQDETESGLRQILNFGHTLGHAIEAISRYGTYLHGEAISIGQVFAARLSAELCQFPERDVRRLSQLFQSAGLPVSIRLTARQRVRLREAMQLDKKVSGGEVKFVLARRIGEVCWGQRVPPELLKSAMASLTGTAAARS